mgnify:FL=1
MTQRNVLTYNTITGIATESTAGTHPGSVTRVQTVRGTPLLKSATRASLGVPNETVHRVDNPAHVQGKVNAEWQLQVHFKSVVSGDRLVGGASDADRSHDILLKHAFGRRYAAAGTTVSGSGSTLTQVDLTSAAGRKRGELVLVGTKVRRITNISSNTITVSPGLGSAPADTTVVRAGRNFVPANIRTATLTIEQKLLNVEDGDTHEERLLGAFGSIAFNLPKHGDLASFTLSGKAISYTAGSSSLSSPSWSLGVSPADDDMAAAEMWSPSVFVDGTATTVEPEGLKIELKSAVTEVGTGAALSGIAGYLDTAGRDGDMAVSVEMTVRLDDSMVSAFDAGTIHHLLVVQDLTYGAGSPGAVIAFEIPRAQLLERPVKVDKGGRAVYVLKYHGLRDTITPGSATTAEDRDLAYAPIRLALF